MSNYTKSTNFATKDTLTSGDPLKIVKGTEINTEFDAISTAIATKADIASPTFTGTVTIPTLSVSGTSTLSSLTASKPVFTDASKGLISTGTLGADQGGTGVANNAASTLTISGAFGTTLTVSGTTAITLPTSGTLVSGTSANNLRLSGATSGTITLAAPAVAGTTTITAPAVTGTMVVLPTTPSVVRLNTANGYGSTNTKIRRFTNTVTNQGSDITYADSATLGASFTINTTGIYGISYSDQFNAAADLGLSLNSTQLTTGIVSITTADALAVATTSANNYSGSVAVTLYASAGSVIRPHTGGTTAGANPACQQFIIVRIA